MKFLDRLALNRLVSIVLSFILSIIKLFKPSTKIIDNFPPAIPLFPKKRKKWFPRDKNE